MARDARHLNPTWVAVATVLTGVSFAANVLEWGVLLRSSSRHVPWSAVSSWQAQSVFFGHIVPTPAAGDALRAVNASRAVGCGHGLASLLGSRMSSALGMALWGLAGTIVLRGVFGLSIVAVGATYALLILVSWLLALTASRAVNRLCAHRCRFRRRAGTFVRPLTDGFHALRRNRLAIGACLAFGLLAYSANLVAFEALGRAVGIDVPITLFAVAVPISMIATLSPISINGMGLREGVLAALLAHAGVDATHAGSLSLLLDVQMVPVAVAGGLLWAATRRRTERAPAPAPAARAVTGVAEGTPAVAVA